MRWFSSSNCPPASSVFPPLGSSRIRRSPSTSCPPPDGVIPLLGSSCIRHSPSASCPPASSVISPLRIQHIRTRACSSSSHPVGSTHRSIQVVRSCRYRRHTINSQQSLTDTVILEPQVTCYIEQVWGRKVISLEASFSWLCTCISNNICACAFVTSCLST